MPKLYPKEFKRDVVTVARRGDATKTQTAKDFGISLTTLKRWIDQADIDEGLVGGQTSTEQTEVVKLRRENRKLVQENEILRRAAAYFARDALPK